MGGKKKKSASAMPAIDARVAGQMPHRVAAKITGIRYAIGTRLAATVWSSKSRTAVIRLADKKENSRGKMLFCRKRSDGGSSSRRAALLRPTGRALTIAR